MDPATLKSLRMMGRGFGVASVPRAQLKDLTKYVGDLEAKVYEHENRELWFRGQLKRMRELTGA
jgi:hypothetical protein